MGKRFLKKVGLFVLMLSVCVCSLSVSVEAKSKLSYMKKTGVKWGIRAGESYTFPAHFNGISNAKPIEWTVSKPKITKAKKSGYKQMQFTMTMTNMSDFTQREVDILCDEEGFGGIFAWYVVDEKDGKTLETKNKHKVSTKVKVLEEKALDGYYNSDETKTFYPPRRYKARITLVYPKGYKGMCFGFGTYKDVKLFSSSDAKFFRGKLALDKTTMFKKSKGCLRFVNLLKL